MGLPGDTRAPHRDQRFIELYNAGSQEIPAFGVCEVVDSERPEAGGTVTPGGGRTILHVQRPSEDNVCNHVVNGSCPIPVGEYGRPGTKDSPMQALVDADYDAGTPVGIEKDSFVLTEDKCGYVVDGDYDATSGTQRVTRYDNCDNDLIVRALECSYPGQSASAQPQRWNSTSKDYEDDPNASTVTVYDPLCYRLALTDEKYPAKRTHCGEDYRVVVPFGLVRRAKTYNPIECDASGSVIIQQKGEGCEWADSACGMYACNTSNRLIGCDADEEFTMVITPGECEGWIIPDTRPMLAIAEIYGDVCGEDVTLTNFYPVEPCDWEWKPTTPTSAKNRFAICACDGDRAVVYWNGNDNDANECGWTLLQVEHQQRYVYTDMVDDCEGTCSISFEKRKICANFCNCDGSPLLYDALPSATVDIPVSFNVECSENGSFSCEVSLSTQRYCIIGCDKGTGTPISVSTDEITVVDGFTNTCNAASGCGTLAYTTKKVCGFCASTGGEAGGTIITYHEEDVMIDFRQNGLNLEAYMTTLCVICAADVGWEIVVEGTDCSSNSSS